jgi:hypothetical protein
VVGVAIEDVECPQVGVQAGVLDWEDVGVLS